MKKLASRKLWMAIGSALASVATALAGLNMDNQVITIIGIICTVASVAIYNICEALVDSSYAGADDYYEEDNDECDDDEEEAA